MKMCIKCGGSWSGKPFDTLCEHDFDEPPEPHVLLLAPSANGERMWWAYGLDTTPSQAHPTREGAIALWKAVWTKRRKRERFAAAFTTDDDRNVFFAKDAPPEPVAKIAAVTLADGTRVLPIESWARPLWVGCKVWHNNAEGRCRQGEVLHITTANNGVVLYEVCFRDPHACGGGCTLILTREFLRICRQQQVPAP